MTGDRDSTQLRVAVVGSGSSGLAAAFHLQRSGFAVELIERDDALGGRFGVGMLGDRPVMLGGKNIGRRYTSFRGFTASLGRPAYEPFGINASRVQDDRIVTVDSTRRGRTARNLLRLGSPRDLARLGSLALRISRSEENCYLGTPFAASLARYDAAPLASHFGAKLTRNLLRAMTVRTNGAEPDEIYLGTFNTNLGLLMDSYDQLSGGIQPVLDALAARVDVTLGTRVESLVVRDGRVAGLRIAQDGSEPRERSFDGVVLATPAYAAAEILRPAWPALGARLAEVSYFPSTVVLVEYDRPVFTPEVRSLAMDDGPCTNAGSYGAEDRHIVRYTFSGREARAPMSEAQIDAWVDQAQERISRHVPLDGVQRLRSVRRHWPAAYSAYVRFHGEFFVEVHKAVAGMPGLELAGDYLRGVSIEACFRSGTEAAARLASSVGGTS